MLKLPLRVEHRGQSNGHLVVSGEYRVMEADGNILAPCLAEERAGLIVQACNEREMLLEQRRVMLTVCKLWLEAVQNSLGLRLEFARLPEGAGPVLVDMLQEAIGLAEGEG